MFSRLEIVEANLLDADSLARAIAGATYVVHTASPFVLTPPRNADDLVRPAVDGTMAVCRACFANKVKRLVITSSCAAIYDVRPADRKAVYTEEDWSNTAHQEEVGGYYALSKTLAERSAWNYQQQLPEKERFELVTINPSLIVGKPLHIHGGFASAELITKLFTG